MTHSKKALAQLLCVGCIAAFTTVATLQAQIQETTPAHDRAAMMAKCQTMMADMNAKQGKLDDLVAKMNAAAGQLKIEEMAAVLTELVAQEKAMHAHMMHMHAAPAANANPQKEQPQAGQEPHRH